MKIKNTTAVNVVLVETFKKTTTLTPGQEANIDPATTLIEIA